MTKNFNPFVLFFLFILISLTVNSQINSLKSCGFDHKHHTLMQNTKYQELIQFSESSASTYLSNPQARSSSGIYTIPVVVHVLHLGENIGVGTNISDAQIQSAITNLNDVYRGQTTNSPVDFQIEFALAQQDPNCNAHSGINRINASGVPNYSTGGVDYYGDGGEADETTLKNLSRWNETEYFNIWIVSEIENNNGGFGIQGYANFFTGSAYEGSIMMATVFGYDPNNSQPTFNLNAPRDNSTVVHEIGHYLHLHHTFKGDGDADNDGIGDACPGDVTVGVDSDGCTDTEPHKRYTSQCKSGLLNDCTGATFGDNTAKNFMSYASCQDRLTNDQKIRSRAMLATSGQSLIFSKGDESPLNISGMIANANCVPQSSATATSGGYGGIMNFTIINEFSASSSNTQNDGGYVDFTTECLKTISLEDDSSYTFEITTWYNGHDYKGFIDFNNDGDFSDPNEEVFSGSNPPNLNGANGTNTSTGNGTLTIPISNGTNILANTPLRFRIISELTSVTGNITDACYNPFYAQAEDYQLVINQANISVQKTYVPDDNFESYLETHDENGNIVAIGSVNSMGDGITNNDSVVSSNISSVTYLDISNQNSSNLDKISDLTGIEDFTSLYHFDAQHNLISNVDLSSNINLNYIFIGYNNLSSLDVSQNLNLTRISATYNSINNIDVSQNSLLRVLELGNNQFTNINVSQNDSLETLSIPENNISNINVYNLQNLRFLSAYQNTISSIDISQNFLLETLKINYNNITSLDVSNNLNLTNLQCHENPIISLDVTNLALLNILHAWNTSITDLNLTQNINLSFLYLGGFWANGSNSSTLNNLDLRNNNNTAITNFELRGNPNLFCVSVDDVSWSTTNWVNIDSHTIFSNNCSLILTANFSVSDSIFCQGTSVPFTDLTSGNPNSWVWNFGDGNSSTLQNPTHTYSSPGTYNVSLTVSDGATTDTETKTSFITVGSPVNTQENIISCDNYNWNGNNYSVSGNYIDTLQTFFGCDSVVTLVLTINNSNNSQENITSCDNYIWNGNTYSQSGTYADTLQTISGCDSTITLILTINQNETSQENISTCNNYIWNGNTYSQSGSYLDTLQTINGCDSIITLNLTISNYISTSENITSCNNYIWNGNTYYQSGTYIDTIATNTGCDSVITLNLTLNQSITSNETIVSCNSYFWNGITYNQSGTYIDTLTTNTGCDSIITLFLTLNNSISSQENITSCSNFLWHGNNYSQSGIYYDTLNSVNGCDSITILNLNINSVVYNQQSITNCNNYVWNGVTYIQSGTYIDTLQTILGCDSIVTLFLTVNSPVFFNDTVSVCNNYIWNGNSYSQTGVYVDTLISALGCDSITSLHLTINGSYLSVDSVSACSSYIWNGITIDSSGVYSDTLQSVNGCDSINILYLTVNNDIFAPLTFELLLDDYCLETNWTIKDSQDSIWYSEGPYDCNPSGGGIQSNTTIIKDLYLKDNECFTFELNDVYGDGLGASYYGGTDGNWLLKDLNNVILSQGSGDFGYSLIKSFFVTQSTPSSINSIENTNGQIYIAPNPFKNSAIVKIKNIQGPFNLEIFDMGGRVIKTFYSINNEFEINNINASSGIYWLRDKNKSNLKPIKLVIE